MLKVALYMITLTLLLILGILRSVCSCIFHRVLYWGYNSQFIYINSGFLTSPNKSDCHDKSKAFFMIECLLAKCHLY